MIAACWLAQFSDTPCSGGLMRCHIIDQQTIKREHSRANPRTPTAWHQPTPLTGTNLRELLDDPRNWRPGCWSHHQHFDGPWAEIPVPESARDFAAQFDLSHHLPARAPRKIGRAA